MVAVVAAAAAAAAASGKTMNVPELPSLETWLSSSLLILRGIASAERSRVYETEINRTGEQDASSSDPLESAASQLESVTALNSRFSNIWCQKVFPVAKKVYLGELPPCYPSSQHEDHLKKASVAFSLMVKGPAVQLYMDKLKDECTSIWSCGRQLCDAVSLTGKPCMHQRHDYKTLSTDASKPHSSGFVYLHACACGRSRQLRPDPFDYETANVTYNFLADCDKLLPAVQLPEQSIKGPIRPSPSSWNLVRIGSARYYDPSKGLLQSGFRATQKFLLRWTIFHEKLIEANCSMLKDFQKVSLDTNIKVETGTPGETKTFDGAQSLLNAGPVQNEVGIQIGLSTDTMDTGSRNTVVGRGLFNFTMKKSFSEVVSGSAAAHSGFPPPLSRKKTIPDANKVVQKHDSGYRGLENIGESFYNVELPILKILIQLIKNWTLVGLLLVARNTVPFHMLTAVMCRLEVPVLWIMLWHMLDLSTSVPMATDLCNLQIILLSLFHHPLGKKRTLSYIRWENQDKNKILQNLVKFLAMVKPDGKRMA